MVDSVLSVFVEKLLNALQEQSQFLTNYGEQFEKLKDELLLMECFLKDLDRRKSKEEIFREIMIRLRGILHDAEDVLVDCQSTQVGSNGARRFPVCFRPAELPSRYQGGKRLAEINEKISQIKQNISDYLGAPIWSRTNSLDTHNQLMSSMWSSAAYHEYQVVGLEDETRKIKGWIFGASEGILTIGIVGMGGLGKTTVALEVFSDRQVEDRFERRIWVSVSQTFTEEKILRSILRSLGDACPGDDRSELLMKIKQYLAGKRYLIVMDDVWSLDDTWWRRIYRELPQGDGNCVIITTRNENVARRMGVKETRTHWPKFLNEHYSWMLFRQVAFPQSGGECVYPELEDVGKEIVEKCKGLPLAIKVVGGVARCKQPHYHEWKQISNHFREELAENDNSVMASLQLSYDELPPYLKSCMLCFSVFPEDCVIDKEQLVHWWIGESFVPVRNHRLSTAVGEDCFLELTSRCLIEVVDKAYNGSILSCKVHDMVLDLVIRIADEEAFSITSNAKCRHLGIKSDMSSDRLVVDQSPRALLTTTKTGEVNKIGSDLAKSFCCCRRLQVLDLSKTIFDSSLSGLIDRIGYLQHLTCLTLSNTHPLIQLPSSISNLRKLLILDLSYCQSLKVLPSCIVKFEKLVVLDVSNCGSLEYLPKGLGGLIKLEVLMGFKPALSGVSHGCRVAELERLSRLRKLELRFTHGDEIGDDEVNALANLQELQFLSLNCFDCHDSFLDSKIDRLVLPRQLHELSFTFYPGKVSPGWLNPMSLPMLRYLSVVSGNLARMNEAFWGRGNASWRIEGLRLGALADLNAEWSMVQGAMPSLRILNVSWCPELECFPIEDAGFKGGVWKREEITRM